MNAKLRSEVKQAEKKNYNIYGVPQIVFGIISSVLISLWLVSVADVLASRLPVLYRVLIYAAVGIPGFLFIFLFSRKREIRIRPYTRQPGFQFLGLHDLKGEELGASADVIQRDEEVACMIKVLEEIIFPQSAVKQALCLVGPSGCGKSTIVNFFREATRDEYLCYDFSGNYHELESRMTELFGTNIDVKLSNLAARQKVVIILDQFERFFFLDSAEQSSVRRVIRALCCRNTAVILSMREEYLADFLKQFDMNDLKADPAAKEHSLSKGIFRELMSIIWRNPADQRENGIIRPARTVSWSGSSIKSNNKTYLNSPFSQIAQVSLEQMGITMFYCQNESNVSVQIDGSKGSYSVILDKCRRLFGKAGEAFFARHEHEPLIEKQIVFHMAEFNQKVHALPDEELQDMIQKNSSELLDEYFDIQLATCTNHFLATRLLYIYSKARSEQIFLKTEDVESGVLPNQFGPEGHKSFMETLDQLEAMQMIRRSSEGSRQEYEIAHDFIAQEFLKYCEHGMNRNVKNSLDLILSEYSNAELKDALKEKHDHCRRELQDKFFRNATIAAIVVMLIGFFVEAFVWNPWTTVWTAANPYGSYFPLFPLIVTLISVIYLCRMYDCIVKFFRGRAMWKCKCCYAVQMIMAVMAVVAYPHFLFLDSIDLVVAAADIYLLLDNHYQKNCQAELHAYGIKSMMMGSVFAFGHVFFWLTNRSFAPYLIFVETVMFSLLVAYACTVHLTQEFLFPRMIDASSEKV